MMFLYTESLSTMRWTMRVSRTFSTEVEAQAELDGGEHSEELFFADFHRAPYRVGMGRVVESCGFDEVFAAEEHPGAADLPSP